MSYSGETALEVSIPAWQAREADPDLGDLCDAIRNADAAEARVLPARILSYLARALQHVEIDIHVEECLPMVCDATHIYLRTIGTFSERHSDPGAVDAARERLIQSLEIMADEVRLCRPTKIAF